VFLVCTRPELTLRAVGENPTAVFADGGNPARVRVIAVLAAAAAPGMRAIFVGVTSL